MATNPTTNLDEFVSAAGAAVGTARSSDRGSSAVATPPAVELDLETLIGSAGAAQQPKADKAPVPKVGAGRTATRSSESANLEQLADQAQRSLASQSVASARTPHHMDSAVPSPTTDISRMVSKAGDITLGSSSAEAPAVESTTPRPEPPPHLLGNTRNAGPLVAAIILLVVLGGGTAWLVEHYWPVDAPLAQKQPLFSVAAERRYLIPRLIEARNEVETYRKRHGSIPKTVDVKADGVEFLISIRGKGYFIAAVQGNYILALTDDGKWLKLGSN